MGRRSTCMRVILLLGSISIWRKSAGLSGEQATTVTRMREPLLGYGPQGYALEKNPWQTQRSIEDAHLYRGAIVGAWANIETAIIEVAIRASIHPAYVGVRNAFPSKLKSRVDYIVTIAELDGPLYPYRNVIKAIVARYVGSADMRNRMAHSRMTVLPNWGATFHGYKAKSGTEIIYDTRRIPLDDMKAMAVRAARFSRATYALLSRLNNLNLLPPVDHAA